MKRRGVGQWADDVMTVLAICMAVVCALAGVVAGLVARIAKGVGICR